MIENKKTYKIVSKGKKGKYKSIVEAWFTPSRNSGNDGIIMGFYKLTYFGIK